MRPSKEEDFNRLTEISYQEALKVPLKNSPSASIYKMINNAKTK